MYYFVLFYSLWITGSLEQSPRLVDPYCQSDAVVVNNDSHIKENIAEAMMENANLNSRETGTCCYS